jgi:hypothetical protein
MIAIFRALVSLALVLACTITGTFSVLRFNAGNQKESAIFGGVAVLLLFAAWLISRSPKPRYVPTDSYWLPPTEKQLEYAERLGIPVPDEVTRGELSELIAAWKKR